jgi:hypothetical protein
MQGQRRWRIIALLATGVAIGVVIAATPATGHISGWTHNWKQHIKPKTDARYYTKTQSNTRFRTHVPGGPLAGANIAADGSVVKYFNRRGGAPTVNKTGTGSYVVTFPGLEGQAGFNNSVVLMSLTSGSSRGEIGRSSSGGNILVYTANSAGTATDQAFDVVLHVPGPLLRPAVAGRNGATDG